MITNVSVWGVLVAALSAMIVGTIWYAKPVFGTIWSKRVGLSDKQMKDRMSVAMVSLVLVSLVTAYVLSLFIFYYHSYAGGSWVHAGLFVSLLSWLGLAGSAVVGHAIWNPKDTEVMWINVGNRLITLVVMGLIIAGFMSAAY